MSRHERRCYRWLRRELAKELGISTPQQYGRTRCLLPEQERRVYAEITAAPRKYRSRVYRRLREEFSVREGLSVSYPTLQRIVAEQGKHHLARVAESFHQNIKTGTEAISAQAPDAIGHSIFWRKTSWFA